MKRLAVVVVLLLVLVGVPLFGACAPKAAPPAPVPTPTQVKIDIISATFGGAAYWICFAFADILNKHHPWIRATCVDSPGTTYNAQYLYKYAEKRPYTVILVSNVAFDYATIPVAKHFPEPYRDVRIINNFHISHCIWGTKDPAIKTQMDLVGKKVALPAVGAPSSDLSEWEWEKLGIKDKIKIVGRMDYGAAAKAVADGIIDVGMTSMTNPAGSTIWEPAAGLKEAQTRMKFNWVSMDAAAMKAVQTEQKLSPSLLGTIPAGAFGPGDPPGAVVTQSFRNGLWADKTMDEKVVYELAKFFCDNLGKLGEYHALGKGMTKEAMAQIPCPLEYVHPGALRYYKEAGIPVVPYKP